MHKFNIGDRVLDEGEPTTVIELPDPRRGGGWDEHYLVQFDNKAYGHDGLDCARVPGDGYHWVRENWIKLISPRAPLSNIEQGIQSYITEQFKELGLD